MTATTQMTLEEQYRIEFLPQINWETVLQGLGLEPQIKGDHFIVKCPKCEKTVCAFYPNINKGEPRFHCSRQNKCQFTDHILAHLNEGTMPRGQDWIGTVRKLSELSGVPFKVDTPTFTKKTKPNILDDYWGFLKSRFPGSPAEQYIKKRGLDPTATPLGYFPKNIKEVQVWAENQGYSEKELIDCGILVEGKNGVFPSMYGRLAGAFIDQLGRIHNLWGRDLTDKVEGSKKYLNLKDTEYTHKKSPYGAEWFNGGPVVFVEGYIDVIAARESGFIAVATGTASIPQSMVDSLSGIKTISTALDQDGAGGDGVFKFIERNMNDENLKIFSINYSLMKRCKDLAELYQKHGKAAVQEVLLPDNLEHVFTFAAEYIIKKNKASNEWTPFSKEAVLTAAVEFDKKVTTASKVPFLENYFWRNGIQNKLDLDPNAIDAMIEDTGNRKEREKVQKKTEELLQKAIEKTKTGDLIGASKDVKDLADCLKKNENPHFIIEPYSLKDLENDLRESSDGYEVGYPELDKMIRLNDGTLNILAARPANGKTTLMMNIFLNMIKKYPNRSFYLFSYEETRKQIATKLINILAGYTFKDKGDQNNWTLEQYIKGGHNEIDAIEIAKKKFNELVMSGRLIIVEERLFVQDLSTTISHYCSKTINPVGTVFVDYVQKIKNKDKFNTRQLELQTTTAEALEIAKNSSIPILLAAQLGRDPNSKDKIRLDNIRECGDIENDSNTVLGICNPAMDKAQESLIPLTDPTITITVTPLKNRNGPVNIPVTLEFHRPTLRIRNNFDQTPR